MAATAAIYVLLILLIIAFSTGCYRWSYSIYRHSPPPINPIMYPSFTLVNTSDACCNRDPYYRLWRIYDWMADGTAEERFPREYLRIPVVYVHGNGGSYFCARSLARFLYEANARLRRSALIEYSQFVKYEVRRIYQMERGLKPLIDGAEVPATVVARAQHTVIMERVPLLATELFAVDFLEESFAQSGALAMKEARFINHSLQLLHDGFLATYRGVLEAPRGTLTQHPGLSTPYPVAEAVLDYTESLCDAVSGEVDLAVCELALSHLERYSSAERLRAEVERVRDSGLWVWTESLGGSVSVMAAILNPRVVAGLVMIGSPTRYPPLFFDVSTVQFYKVLMAAALRHHRQRRTTINWEERILPHRTPLELLSKLRALPSSELGARIANLTMLSINGGSLDDIIPPISGYLHHSPPQRPAGPGQAAMWRTSPLTAPRRDLSTEYMRGVALPFGHRDLVYGLEFLNATALSVVRAVLLPDAERHFAPEWLLPSPTRDRLFPTITETLPSERLAEQTRYHLFALSLEERDGKLVKTSEAEAVSQHMSEVCVDGLAVIPRGSLPTIDSDAGFYDGYYNGEVPFHLFLGSTTHNPNEVHLPRLEMYANTERTQRWTSEDVATVPTVKLHIPFPQNEATLAPNSQTLRTVVSFRVTRGSATDGFAYPRFCFWVPKQSVSSTQRTFFQSHVINSSSLAARRRELHLGLHYVGNRVTLEQHDGYMLLHGVDSTTVERNMRVSVHPTSAVLPLTLCGSLHAFFRVARGTTNITTENAEEQLRLFVPHHANTGSFTYSWRVFSAFEWELNGTYMVYMIGDANVQNPQVEMVDLSGRANSSMMSVAYWLAWANQEPERWLAFFSSYSEIGKLGSSYALFFYTFHVFTDRVRVKLYGNPILRPRWRWRMLEKVVVASPLLTTFVAAIVVQLGMGTLVTYLSPVCIEADPLTTLSDTEMTLQMGWAEKLVLALLYFLPPNYTACQYPWIRMHTVPVWASFPEHIGTMYIGFVISMMAYVMVLGIGYTCRACSAPFHWLFTRHLMKYPWVIAVLLVACWCVPLASFWLPLALPISFRHLLGTLTTLLMIGLMPSRLVPGYHFPAYCQELCIAATFPAHFEGFFLTLRNYFVLAEKNPEAFWDVDRYYSTSSQLLAFGLVQVVLGGCYATFFLVALHTRGVEQIHALKERSRGVDKPSLPSYVLGDVGRRWRWLRPAMDVSSAVLTFLSMWTALVSLRRPLEGGVCLVGNILLLYQLLTTLVRHW